MKILYNTLFAGLLGLLAVFTSSCDWTGGGGSSDFNTSQGAGVNVNWSGVYFGSVGTTAGSLSRLVLSQGGNRVEVVDDRGSRYEGSVGAPGVVSTAGGGILSTGSTLVESQIQWTGKDEASGLDVEFVGILHVVAVEDIQGQSTETIDARTSPTTNSVTVIDRTTNPDGTVVVETDVQEDVIEGDKTETITTTVYQITEANSQFRLQGTWIEQGGRTSGVDFLSPGGIGTITTTN